LFLIVFLESKVVKSMSSAPTYSRLPAIRTLLPIPGLLACSQRGKNRRFSRESWKVAQSKGAPFSRPPARTLPQLTDYDLLRKSVIRLVGYPHVLIDPPLNSQIALRSRPSGIRVLSPLHWNPWALTVSVSPCLPYYRSFFTGPPLEQHGCTI
jgi:hypothetical protein